MIPLYCTVVAEAGVNHNGNIDLAFKLIDAAVAAGADMVKFQTFKSELLASPKAPQADYQKEQAQDNNQLEMLKKLELPLLAYARLFQYAKEKNIACISTPFDLESLDFLVGLGMSVIKIPSGEVTNGPFLLAAARTKLPIILSTGMSNLEEIERALAVLAFGYSSSDAPHSFDEIWQFWQTPEAKKSLKGKVTILHCTTNYPAQYEEINLNAMTLISEAFNLPVGYSDHSLGILVPTVAASMGAVIIEKHITLDKKMEGPDHSASLEPHELKEMITKIRDVCRIKGLHKKFPSTQEIKNIPIVRRGVYVLRDISQGDTLSKDNLVMLRPENEVSPMSYWDVINKPAQKKYASGDAL